MHTENFQSILCKPYFESVPKKAFQPGLPESPLIGAFGVQKVQIANHLFLNSRTI